jgi:hypothetical protein
MVTPMHDWRWTLKLEIRLWWRRTRERLITGLVWRLPRVIIYWATIRLAAHATTGQFSATNPNDLSVMEALKRWESPDGGDPKVRRIMTWRRHG